MDEKGVLVIIGLIIIVLLFLILGGARLPKINPRGKKAPVKGHKPSQFITVKDERGHLRRALLLDEPKPAKKKVNFWKAY